MNTQQLKKSLPKRCLSEGLKRRRAASWARTQAKKKARQAAQDARHKTNLKLIAAGLPTPHEAKKIAVKERRLHDVADSRPA